MWCVQVIGSLRRLGLTISEIGGLAEVYLKKPEKPIGPYLDHLLGDVDRRLDRRIEELEDIRGRVREFRRQDALGLAGGLDFSSSDPTRP